MAEKDESYDEALQRTMHTVLPSILAEIADFRPADPIQYLAQCLYKTREREDAQEQGQNSAQHEQNGSQHKQNVEHDVKTKHSPSHLSRQDIHATTQSNVLKNKQSHGENLTRPNRTRQDVILKELSDFEYITVGTDIQVHCEVKTLFTRIGDLFDDADIS